MSPADPKDRMIARLRRELTEAKRARGKAEETAERMWLEKGRMETQRDGARDLLKKIRLLVEDF